jgi:hypothetical protein
VCFEKGKGFQKEMDSFWVPEITVRNVFNFSVHCNILITVTNILRETMQIKCQNKLA